MSEKKEKEKKVNRDENIVDRKINMEEIMKPDEFNITVIRKNEPNMRLMAIAWLNLMNQK